MLPSFSQSIAIASQRSAGQSDTSGSSGSTSRKSKSVAPDKEAALPEAAPRTNLLLVGTTLPLLPMPHPILARSDVSQTADTSKLGAIAPTSDDGTLNDIAVDAPGPMVTAASSFADVANGVVDAANVAADAANVAADAANVAADAASEVPEFTTEPAPAQAADSAAPASSNSAPSLAPSATTVPVVEAVNIPTDAIEVPVIPDTPAAAPPARTDPALPRAVAKEAAALPVPSTASDELHLATAAAGTTTVSSGTASVATSSTQATAQVIPQNQLKFAGRSVVSAGKAASAASSVKDGAKQVKMDTVGTKQHDKMESTSVSVSPQDAGSNDDQAAQENSQGQSGATAPVVATGHAIFTDGQAQSATNVSLAQPVMPAATSTAASSTQNAPARPTDASAAAASQTPQAVPVINTAKLIQSVGQTEMRVGMRSSEFGAISIHTSATRDTLSAEISLDHADLAKALAAHLPEMQTRLGGEQTLDVRIHDVGQSSSTMSGREGSTGNTGGSRQQQSGSGSSYTHAAMEETQAASVNSEIVAMNGGVYSRLDIRA